MSSEATFEAPVVLEFVKTYISDGSDPHLWIAGAIDLPVPADSQEFKVPVDDIHVFYGLNILSVPEMYAEYNKFRLERQVITQDPYTAIPEPVIEEVQASIAGNGNSRGARVLQEARERDSLDKHPAAVEPVSSNIEQQAKEPEETEEQLSYKQWLDKAVQSGEFDYIGHDKSLYNRFFSPSLATILNNYEKSGGGDATVDSLKQRIAQADLTLPNTEYIYQGSKIWTRTGERLVGELQQALNSFYHSKQMKLLKYDLRNLEKGAASYKKLPQPGSPLWTSFISQLDRKSVV